MSTGSYTVKLREETAEREAVVTGVTPDVTRVYENPLHGDCRERRARDRGLRSPNIPGAERAGRVADRTEWKEPDKLTRVKGRACSRMGSQGDSGFESLVYNGP